MEDIKLTDRATGAIRLSLNAAEDDDKVNKQCIPVPVRIHAADDSIRPGRVEKLESLLRAVIPPEIWTLSLFLQWEKVYYNIGGLRYKLRMTLVGPFIQELYKLYLAGLGKNESCKWENLKATYFYCANGYDCDKTFDLSFDKLREYGLLYGNLVVLDGLPELEWGIQLTLEGHVWQHLMKTLTPFFVREWRYLNEDGGSGNFTLVAGDGTRISCLKFHLNKSPILAALVKNVQEENDKDVKDNVKEEIGVKRTRQGVQESPLLINPMIKPNFERFSRDEARLQEMSADGITGMLEYLYLGALTWAKKDAAVAVELFQAAHNYQLPAMEAEVKALLLKMEPTLFTGKLALDLFHYLRNYYTGEKSDKEQLKRKVIEKLRSIQDIEHSGVLDDLLDFGADMSKEILALALKK